MRTKHSNGFAIVQVLIIIAILFIGFFAIMRPYGKLFDMLVEDSNFAAYNTENLCNSKGGYWDSGVCQALADRPHQVIMNNRAVWLITPFIVVIGLIFWALTLALKRDRIDTYLR